MGRRSRKAEWYAELREPTAAREVLERRWFPRLEEDARLGAMVTAETAQHEPLHRWLRFRQGYSPALVRLMLSENRDIAAGAGRRPILDPFSGSGTCAIECARRGVSAVGVEAVASLAFLTNVRMERELPPLPDLPDAAEWQALAPRLERSLHRAALMLAVARQHTTAGRLNPSAEPLRKVLADTMAMMADDLRSPARVANVVHQGDARKLDVIEDESVGAVLTSPPYLSRHDYARITSPYESVYRFWYESEVGALSRAEQLRASPRARRLDSTDEPERRDVAEIGEAFAHAGEPKLAGVAAGYFEDLRRVLEEMFRVLTDGGRAWVVIGGARLKDVYVPSDLIAAEIAEECGFDVEALRVAREVVGSRRKFGRIGKVAPRETVIALRKT